jgi:hypothetical protein
MKIDNNGIFYYDEHDKGKEIIFEKDFDKKKPEESSKFYKLLNNPELIIKYATYHFNDEKVMYMLKRFIELQKKVKLTDLPTSYYMEDGVIKGTVIPYYPDSPTLYNIALTRNLLNLANYYYHDDDMLHNLFLLFNDMVNVLEELVENNILYFDANPGNFVFSNNQIKLIDFDPECDRIKYEVDKKSIKKLLNEIDTAVFLVTKRFQVADLCVCYPKNFKSYRKHLIKVENRIRNGKDV